ncbi:MAG: 2-aminoethylphosphonate--pyruvate transaminase [Planctomycetota bacterium]|jgi:2-aminoethylphosphonate-pyruvate transaminase|nr:2-aminoethylphosphonate--pyruvate transaminase [Planctomycetota bacterium]
MRRVPWRDKLLFAPGPLTTSPAVKAAMLRDLGARDDEFLDIVADVKNRLLTLAGVDRDSYAAVLVQGCGSMGVEAAIGCAVPRAGGKLLVAVNGAYGRRMVDMAEVLGIPVDTVAYPENVVVVPDDIGERLAADKTITHVAMVHCETTTGIFNPIGEMGKIVAERGRVFMVDAMSSFGATEIRIREWGIRWLVSSANKCLEGVPGFCFVIVAKGELAAGAGNARSLCLDLRAQDEDMRKTGQFRYTPPTHAILAFHQALLELEAEGGTRARTERYKRNCRMLRRGMAALGFREFLASGGHGWIITSFRCPEHGKFSFAAFSAILRDGGFVIYPGKVGGADLFRVGSIGRIDAADVAGLIDAMRRALAEMGVTMPPEEAPE